MVRRSETEEVILLFTAGSVPCHSGYVEHVMAYSGTTFITAMAFAERGLSRLALALPIYAGGLEFLQRLSPGRTSS